MSAFIPTNTDGHQTSQTSSANFNDMCLPYFPAAMIHPYFNSANGYQFNPTAGISGGFPNMGSALNSMNNMTNLHSNSQIPQFSTDPSNAARFFQNNNISLYNTKNEIFEPPTVPTPLLNNDSKSSVSSMHDSMHSRDLSSMSSPDENHRSPLRTIKPSKTPKMSGFKSPEEESAYRVRRQKNNEAARMSRIRRQQREKELQIENDKLKNEVAYWKNKYTQEIGAIKANDQVLTELQNR